MLLQLSDRAKIFLLMLTAALMFGGAGCSHVYIPNESALQKTSLPEARNKLSQSVRGPDGKFSDIYLDGPDIKQINVIGINVIDCRSIVFVGKDGRKKTFQLKDINVEVENNTGLFGEEMPSVIKIDKYRLYSFIKNKAEFFGDAILALKIGAVNEDKLEASFEKAVKESPNSAVNTILSENVRRYKVQAEGAIRDKSFYEAADILRQALIIAPLWPEGHFNRAIVLSEVREFDLAINEMNRYLRLVPDAQNARAAQDKIYDWERNVNKQN